MKRIVLGMCLIFLANSSVFASALHDAKASGLVGERNDGYLGYVVTPPSDSIKKLVKNVNNMRKTKFSQTAASNNLKTEQVANRFYQRAVGKTAAGEYYQNATGNWIKK